MDRSHDCIYAGTVEGPYYKGLTYCRKPRAGEASVAPLTTVRKSLRLVTSLHCRVAVRPSQNILRHADKRADKMLAPVQAGAIVQSRDPWPKIASRLRRRIGFPRP